MHDTDIFDVVDLLEQFMDQQARAVTPVERQSWDVVVDIASNSESVSEMEEQLTKALSRLEKGCTYRKVLRLALAHITEMLVPSAHAV